MISGIIGGILVVLAWQLWQYFRSKQTEKDIEPATTEVANGANDALKAIQQAKSCEDIVLESLRKLQCEPEVEDRGDGVHTIYFEYQAERFSINVEATSRFVALFDAFWYSFEEDDLEQLSNVKHIVNNLNWSSSLNVCYNRTDENKMINLHTTYSMLCFEEVDFTAYLRHVLRECFVIHNNFFKQMAEASVMKDN